LGNEVNSILKSGGLVTDQLMNNIVMKHLSNILTSYILDGYPRTLSQAQFFFQYHQLQQQQQQNQQISLTSFASQYHVIHITLRKDIILQKLLNRRICSKCFGNFNLANVNYDGYEMPAILPSSTTCLSYLSQQQQYNNNNSNNNCNNNSNNNNNNFDFQQCYNHFHQRSDDTIESITQRLLSYHQTIEPILQYYQQLQCLTSFEVKKGIQDTEKLIELMMKEEQEK
jgi:adenylate kinase family enzyme